jgi:hypothetical protein
MEKTGNQKARASDPKATTSSSTRALIIDIVPNTYGEEGCAAKRSLDFFCFH